MGAGESHGARGSHDSALGCGTQRESAAGCRGKACGSMAENSAGIGTTGALPASALSPEHGPAGSRICSEHSRVEDSIFRTQRSRSSRSILGDAAAQNTENEPPQKMALAIGPEGGWTDGEFGAALAAGFREASIGKNILRTETAVIAGLAAAHLYFDGDVDGAGQGNG